MGNPQVTDVGLTALAELKFLQTLDLRGTQVTEAGIADVWKAQPGAHIAIGNIRSPASRMHPFTQKWVCSSRIGRFGPAIIEMTAGRFGYVAVRRIGRWDVDGTEARNAPALRTLLQCSGGSSWLAPCASGRRITDNC